jgi:hypothetical protein
MRTEKSHGTKQTLKHFISKFITVQYLTFIIHNISVTYPSRITGSEYTCP